MRLYGYNTLAGTLGKDVTSFSSSDLNGNPPFQWLDNPLGGYSDIHKIELIATYGYNLGKDYKFVRDTIKKIVVAAGSGDEEQGFNAIDSVQKDICARLKIGTHAQRMALLGIDDLVIAMTNYRNETQEVRDLRSIRAEVELRNRLHDDTAAILSVAGTVFANYKLYGIDGTEFGDTVPGIADYINGTSVFTGGGLRDSSYEPEGMDINAFCDLIINILIHGNY